MTNFDPELDKRLTIMAALETGVITADEAERRLRPPPKRGRGRPGKPAPRFRMFSPTSNGEKPAKAIDQTDIGAHQQREIGRRYLDLRRQHSARGAMSRLQRELFKADPTAPCSEEYILKCRRQYLAFLRYGHLLENR